MSKLLSDDELGFFMDMESLFNHPGWERLTKEIAAEVSALPATIFASAKSWEALLAARERYAALQTLLAYPTLMDQRRANLEREREAQIEEVNGL